MCVYYRKIKNQMERGRNCSGSQNYFPLGKGTDNETALGSRERRKRNAGSGSEERKSVQVEKGKRNVSLFQTEGGRDEEGKRKPGLIYMLSLLSDAKQFKK